MHDVACKLILLSVNRAKMSHLKLATTNKMCHQLRDHIAFLVAHASEWHCALENAGQQQNQVCTCFCCVFRLTIVAHNCCDSLRFASADKIGSFAAPSIPLHTRLGPDTTRRSFGPETLAPSFHALKHVHNRQKRVRKSSSGNNYTAIRPNYMLIWMKTVRQNQSQHAFVEYIFNSAERIERGAKKMAKWHIFEW